LKKQPTVTTRLDTGESVVWQEWQELEAARKKLSLAKKSPLQQDEDLPLPARGKKPKAIRRHSRFFAGARR